MSELSDLISAAELSPGKGGLMRALLRAAEAALDSAEAVDWLARCGRANYDAETREAVAAFLKSHGESALALDWIEGREPRLHLARARLLLDMHRPREAAEEYRAALAIDASLADAELESRLKPKLAAGGPESGNVVDLRGRRLEPEEAAAQTPPAGREKKTFADVGGLESVKKDIERKIILPFRNPSLFSKFKRKAGGGVLLYGPPGCGKTMMARATAGEVGAAFMAIEIVEILDMYIGESEKRLSQAFAKARDQKPAVLFFDEIEALAATRRFGQANHGASLVSTFLNELDGINAGNEGVLILAATNTPWAIDTAFRRPGRFDRVVFIPPPDEAARRSILEISLKGRPQEGINLAPIAAATSGFSGADLAGLVEAACDFAIEESLEGDNVVPIRQRHLSEAAKAAKPTTLEWLSQARNYAKYANEGGLYDDVAAFLDKHSK